MRVQDVEKLCRQLENCVTDNRDDDDPTVCPRAKRTDVTEA